MERPRYYAQNSIKIIHTNTAMLHTGYYTGVVYSRILVDWMEFVLNVNAHLLKKIYEVFALSTSYLKVDERNVLERCLSPSYSWGFTNFLNWFRGCLILTKEHSFHDFRSLITEAAKQNNLVRKVWGN